MLCAALTLTIASCSAQSALEPSQTDSPPAVDGKSKNGRTTSGDEAASDAGAADAETRISTRKKELDASADASDGGDASEAEAEGEDSAEAETPKKPAKNAEEPSDKEAAKKQEQRPRDEGSPDESKDEEKPEEPEQPKVDAECTRLRLREKAEAYLASLTTGDTMGLRIHPSFRYTENGSDQALGGGAWLRRGESRFSRNVLDETRCSSLTQAVMEGLTGRFSFGVRLRYRDGLLLEAEAQVVPEVLAATDLDSVIPMGDDRFATEVPEEQRMSRDALFDFAQRYFDSVTGVSNLPPSAPECRRLQNGVPLGDGTCTRPPGTARFEQQRFDLADELNGVVTATVLYEDHIGFYLMKITDDMLQSIEVIGGATSQATGW